MDTIRFVRRSLVSGLLAGCAAPALLATTAVAAPRCDAPQGIADRRACDAAREGPQALRRFIGRTQSIYGLYFPDYMTAAELDRHHHAREQAVAAEREPRGRLAGVANAR